MNNIEFLLSNKDKNEITNEDCQKGVIRITSESKYHCCSVRISIIERNKIYNLEVL